MARLPPVNQFPHPLPGPFRRLELNDFPRAESSDEVHELFISFHTTSIMSGNSRSSEPHTENDTNQHVTPGKIRKAFHNFRKASRA